MYSVRVEGHFSSAHNLRGYKGKCEGLHGHNWRIEVVAVSDKLDHLGVVLDFTILKAHLREITDHLDHKYLNEIPYFMKINPTSENIAKYIYDQLKAKIPEIDSVTVWESLSCSATYRM